MEASQRLHSDGVVNSRSRNDTQSQDDPYRLAAAEFGAALARLATAYEANAAYREDLLQDIHLALWRSFAVFGNRCALRTWVYRVAHNTASTHVLRQKRARLSRLVSVEELDAMPGDADDDRLLDARATLEKLAAIIRKLKPIDREVMLLHLEGCQPVEIADIVGISPNNVAQKIHRTKKVLRDRLLSGGEHTDA